MKNKKIPIKAAREISEKYNYPGIVILAYDTYTGMQHVTTYAKTKEQCIDAARAGNFLKKALEWPKNLCDAKPSRQSPTPSPPEKKY